jgi:hypothetical protein
MPRSFQLPRALQLENATVVEDERHQDPAGAREVVFGRGYLTAACEISNDPPDEGEILDLTVCNITMFRCSPLTSYMPTVVEIPIPYDYQITYLPEADFARVLPFVEESILESLATAMNLKQCPGTGTNRRNLRRSLQDDFTTTQQGRFIGVSLLPRDYRDQRFASCLPEEDGAEFTDSECQPIRGSLTVSLALPEEELVLLEEDEEALRLAVLNFVERNMGEDTYAVPGKIDRLTYVGARQVIAGGGLVVGEQNIKDTNNGGGLSGAGRGLLSAAVPLFFIMLVLSLVLRKRKRKDGDYSNQQKELMPGILAMPEEDEDEQNYISRSSSASGKVPLSPKSLAFADSLALESQVVTEDQMSGVEVRSRGPPSFSNSPANSPRSPSRSIVEVEEEGKELRAEDVADYDINMITDTGSQQGSQQGSQDSLFDIDEEGEDVSEDTSEYTPRRALQMS